MMRETAIKQQLNSIISILLLGVHKYPIKLNLFLKILKILHRGVFLQTCLHKHFRATASVISLDLFQFSFLDDWKMEINTSALW